MASLATLNPQQNRRLAIAVLVAGVLAIIAVVALPVWLLNRHYDNALSEGRGTLERYTRIASTRAEVSRQLEAMRAKEPRKYFLRGGAPSLSAAELQEAVRGVVEKAGGRLITMQPPTSKEEGRYRQVTVNVQLTANVFAMRNILSAIETNVPYLFVESLTVRSQVPHNFRPTAGAEPEMFVQLDVSGYVLAAAS